MPKGYAHVNTSTQTYAPMRERDAKLLTYIQEGHTYSEAARHFKLTRQRVQQIAQREAVPTTRPPIIKDKILRMYYDQRMRRAVDIAELLGCNASYVRDVLSQERKLQQERTAEIEWLVE